MTVYTFKVILLGPVWEFLLNCFNESDQNISSLDNVLLTVPFSHWTVITLVNLNGITYHLPSTLDQHFVIYSGTATMFGAAQQISPQTGRFIQLQEEHMDI